MAKSPAHQLGEFIGTFIEGMAYEYIKPIAEECGMYCDHKHSRQARNNAKEVIWKDINDNKHKLDIVIEHNGSEEESGTPKAFIEVAWRRYTKHSKNKVQEISAAIESLGKRYSIYNPFFGAILGGIFTESAIKQLESSGFTVIYIPLETIEKAFLAKGMNIHTDENTPESDISEKCRELMNLSDDELIGIKYEILSACSDKFNAFATSLTNALKRKAIQITLFSWKGCRFSFETTEEACNYLSDEYTNGSLNLEKYDIAIRYSNGDETEMTFSDRQSAIRALRNISQY